MDNPIDEILAGLGVGRRRIVQVRVPGKQITMAHILASPEEELFRHLGVLNPRRGALAILTITPGEGAVISADFAVKKGDVDIVFTDRFSGGLVLSGGLSAVEAAVEGVLTGMQSILGFTPCEITRS